jgi:hypothetical protein
MTTALEATAAFIVAEATALGIAIGTDRDELVLIVPMSIPAATRRDFKEAVGNYADEIVAHLISEYGP